MIEFLAYTDGACSGNPGPGGWGVVLLARKNGNVVKRVEHSGGVRETTNNRMELQAAIAALNALSKKTKIVIVTDSKYVQKGITDWLPRWKKNLWKTSTKKNVKNKDLWEKLDILVNQNEVEWLWVKGHAGDTENERADTLARQEVEALLDDKAKNN